MEVGAAWVAAGMSETGDLVACAVGHMVAAVAVAMAYSRGRSKYVHGGFSGCVR